ncbi:MAG: hypothetical protein IIX02_01000, partial [Clostridia bacterium]|nr:hypothetical protein [Clostridia bacterium]
LGEDMAAHPGGGSGVETVAAEETAGIVGGEDLPVEEHTDEVGVFGAELHIEPVAETQDQQ